MLSVGAMTGMVDDLAIDAARMKDAARAGFTTATDLADWLVRTLGLPFREAHHAHGPHRADGRAKGCDISELPLADLRAVERASTARCSRSSASRIPPRAGRASAAPHPPSAQGGQGRAPEVPVKTLDPAGPRREPGAAAGGVRAQGRPRPAGRGRSRLSARLSEARSARSATADRPEISMTSGFHRKKGALHADALLVATLARDYGTPLWIYSQSVLEARYKKSPPRWPI